MKALLVNSSDISGGAARGAFRLHQGLLSTNVLSRMLVQEKRSNDPTVIGPKTRFARLLSVLNPFIDLIPLELYGSRQTNPYHLGWISSLNPRVISAIKPNIVHLHWICRGYVRIEQIRKISVPVVWTFHDCWAFTGGCHFPFDCDRYEKACGRCPQLGSKRERDLSRWVWKRKKRAWQNVNLTVVAPSRWMAQCATNSPLFQHARVEVIPNGLDLTRFRPMSQSRVRDILRLPKDKVLILFGALDAMGDRRKGFQFLNPLFLRLRRMLSGLPVEVVIFGSSKPENPPEFGFKTHYTGLLSDEISLAMLYAAADLFITPSMQDNLPNIVMESLACGTPCVAFDIGGMPDMIEHQKNGYLAKPFDTDDFANGVNFVLGGNSRTEEAAKSRIGRLRDRAREKVVQEFDIHTIAKRHKRLYEQILANDR
jgi:glycosyltransferase involved in cell wall biosynthesis